MRADIARTGHQIFVEVARPLARIRIIGLRGLIERVAHAHPGAADELLLDELGVERAPDFIGAGHLQHGDIAGLVVDFHFGDKAGVGVAGRRRHLAGLRIDVGERHQKNATPGNGAALAELRRDGDVAHRDRAVRRAFDTDRAFAIGLEVAGIDFEFLRRRLHHHRTRLTRRHHHRIADAVRAARGERAHAMWPGIGIGGVDIDVLDRHAQRLGADLPRHRFHALAEVDRRQSDGEFSARIGVDQRLARIAAEIHADRIVDGRNPATAMLAHDQRLLVPKTEEKRGAPCVEPAGDADGGGGALRGGGAGGATGAAAAGRS